METGETSLTIPSLQAPRTTDPRRILIREKLAKLVSSGTAKLYNDACKQLEAGGEFSATTHTVAHLLREVESSVRAVLRPLTSLSVLVCDVCEEPISGEQCACGRPKGLVSHNAEIDAVLSALGFDQKDDIRKAWRSYARKSHKYAHRDGLEEPRRLDQDFDELWAQLEIVLVGALDRFESRYTAVLTKLDELIRTPVPTNKEVTFLCSNITNSQIVREYFFDNLQNPAWLPLLAAKDLFKKLPARVHLTEGGVYDPRWPPARYLRRMIPSHPKEVTQILANVEETDNETVKSTLIELATELPEAERTTLMPRLLKWL